MTSKRRADDSAGNESFSSQSPAVPHRFLVTSRGASATRWLCFALASHPDVFVAHGKHSLQSIQQGQFDSERRQDDTASLALGNVMSDFYRCRSLDEVFDIYRYLQPAAQAYGSVHTYQLEEVHSRFSTIANQADLRIVNVIRHPVTYIASHTDMVRSGRRYPALRKSWRIGFEHALAQHTDLLRIDQEDPDIFEAFVVSCDSVARWVADFGDRSVAHIKMEVVTSEIDRLVWFCEYLTRLPYDRQRLAGFIEDGPINRHRRSTAAITPHDVYGGWEPWQRKAAALILPDELLGQLEAEGYDVSMLRNERRQSVPRADTSRLWSVAESGPPAAADAPANAPPILVEEGYRGFNMVRFQAQHIALAHSLGPVDLTRVNRDWWPTHIKEKSVFIGESLLDVKRQVDQLTIEDVLQAAIQALQQIRATDDRTADATNQIVPALEYIRVQLTSLLEQPTLPELTREGWLENARSLLQQDSGTWWMRVVHLLRIKPGKKSSSMTPDDRGRKAA